jgi:RND superfamily putative drug exporter
MNALQRAGHSLARVPGGKVGKWVVLGVWLVLLLGLGSLAGKLNGAENNQASSWLPGSAESTQVVNLTGQFHSTNQAPAVIVYERTGGLTPQDVAKATADTAKFATVTNVVPHSVIGPVPSKDGKALLTQAQIDMGTKDGWNALGPAVDSFRSTASSGDPGLNVHITGPAGIGADQSAAFKGIDGTLLYSTIAVVVILLLITYRSPILWLLPLMSSGLALAVAEGLIYLLAKQGLTVNAQSAGILLVLVMGAGTDYALLLIARYREELRRHEDRHEAMGVALHRAGPAILASAATVAIGMLCLTAAEMNSTSGLGPVSAIGVLVALLAMVTLLPALLTIFGRWIFWPVRPVAGIDDPSASGLWSRIGGGIAKRSRVVWIGTVVILGAIAFGITGLKADGLSTAGSFTNTPDSVIGQQVVAAHYPAGSGSPVVVIAKASGAAQVEQALAATPGIGSVGNVATKNGYVYMEGSLVPAADSQAAKDTIDRARTNVHAVPGADAKVGGNTAVVLDTERASQHDDKVIIPLILIVVLVILGLLLRALIAPIVLILTVVLSFGTALGLSTIFFNHVFHFSGEDGAYPLLAFVFLVALGIDYNIFLMTRIREEAARLGTRRGAGVGLAATGGVITSAGMILAGTFGVLGTLPVVGFAEIGFTVAVGVLLDTFIVRSILVTALAMDLDRRVWWPSRLSRAATPAVAIPAQAGESDVVRVP